MPKIECYMCGMWATDKETAEPICNNPNSERFGVDIYLYEGCKYMNEKESISASTTIQ